MKSVILSLEKMQSSKTVDELNEAYMDCKFHLGQLYSNLRTSLVCKKDKTICGICIKDENGRCKCEKGFIGT